MKLRIISIWIQLAFCLVSCTKKEDGTTGGNAFVAVTSTFLTASDFTSSNEEIIAQSNLSSQLNYFDDLRHYDGSTSSSSSIEACFSDFKVRVLTSDSISIGGEKDIASCFSSSSDSGSTMVVTYNKAKIKTYMKIKCDGVNLSQYDGQSITSTLMDQITTTCGTAPQSQILNSINESDYTVTYNGSSTRYSVIYTSATMSASGDDCTRTYNGTNWIHGSGCTKYKKEKYLIDASGNEGKDEITKVTFNNLVESTVTTDPLFVSGTADLYYQGWQGTVTYNGVNTSANWSLTRDGITVIGTISPIYLKANPLMNFIYSIPRL